jgi:hypothetical protein
MLDTDYQVILEFEVEESDKDGNERAQKTCACHDSRYGLKEGSIKARVNDGRFTERLVWDFRGPVLLFAATISPAKDHRIVVLPRMTKGRCLFEKTHNGIVRWRRESVTGLAGKLTRD